MSTSSALGVREHERSARAALALAALRQAEERTGARPANPAPPVVKERGLDMAERPALAVPAQLAELLPGGVRRGSVIQVTGSAALMLEMVATAGAAASHAGQTWTAVVGQPTIGVLAAAEMGVDLSRLILVPTPGPDAVLVLAALLDGVEILVIGPEAALLPSDRRKLAARARERGAVIIATTPWSGAHIELNVTGVRWRGLGMGNGRLQSRELLVERTGRGSAAQRVRVEVVLPSGALAEPKPAHRTVHATKDEPETRTHPEFRLVG